MIRTSEKIDELAKALAKAQGMIKHAEKDSKNPHFKSSYSSLASVLDALKEPFAANGLSMIQPPSRNGPDVVVTTRLLHESGQWIEEDCAARPQQETPQAVGSCVTYLRRYAGMGMGGIAPADDDGNAATQAPAIPTYDATTLRSKEPQEPAWAKGVYTGTDPQKKLLAEYCKKLGVTDPKTMGKISAEIKLHQVDMENIYKAVEEYIKEGASV